MNFPGTSEVPGKWYYTQRLLERLDQCNTYPASPKSDKRNSECQSKIKLSDLGEVPEGRWGLR